MVTAEAVDMDFSLYATAASNNGKRIDIPCEESRRGVKRPEIQPYFWDSCKYVKIILIRRSRQEAIAAHHSRGGIRAKGFWRRR